MAYNFKTWLGIEGDNAVHHQSQGLGSTSTLYIGGPRIAHRTGVPTLFAHILAGGATTYVNFHSGFLGFGGLQTLLNTQSALAAGSGREAQKRPTVAKS